MCLFIACREHIFVNSQQIIQNSEVYVRKLYIWKMRSKCTTEMWSNQITFICVCVYVSIIVLTVAFPATLLLKFSSKETAIDTSIGPRSSTSLVRSISPLSLSTGSVSFENVERIDYHC